ncbi:hypothetical protein FACS189452_04440 [Bacteroidia bacterium]|nr:hypothetical protein FACS189452_04440 [Bacteroidia bacterium]GHT81240.1 hypothetical protein FACS189467_4940 [Bacteroidia bacterium]
MITVVQNAFAQPPDDDVSDDESNWTDAPVSGNTYQAMSQTLSKEWSLYFMGGASALSYKTDAGTVLDWQNPSVLPNLLSGGAGIEWTFFLKEQLGLRFGLEVASYKNTWSSDNMTERFDCVVPGFEVGTNKPFETKAEGLNSFAEYKETQNVWFLQLPIMFQIHRTPDERKAIFYIAAGLKPAMSLMNSYAIATSGNTTLNLPDYQQELNNVGHGTGPFNYSETGKMKLNLNVNLSAEMGIRWRVKPTFSLYTGIYADYGLLNIVTPQENLILPYNTGGELNNLFASQHLVGNVSTIAAGIKLRLAFGTVNKLSARDNGRSSDARVRVAIRDAATNRPLMTTITTKNNYAENGEQHDDLMYDEIDNYYRITLPDNSNYNVAFNVKLPNDVDMQKMPELNLPELRRKNQKRVSNKLSHIEFVLLDKQTEKILPAIVKRFNIDNNKEDTLNTANTGGTYSITVKRGTFNQLTFNVMLPQVLKVDKPLFNRVRENAIATLRDENFNMPSNLAPELRKELQKMIDFLSKNDSISVEIAVHTDNKLPQRLSKRLSSARAKAIVNYIAKNGIDRKRMRPVGYGNGRPRSKDRSKAGKERNRRIEMKITKIKSDIKPKPKPKPNLKSKPKPQPKSKPK